MPCRQRKLNQPISQDEYVTNCSHEPYADRLAISALNAVPQPMSWSLKFDERIALANGEALRYAGQHLPALPKATQRRPEWQTAIEMLLSAAEGRSDVREYGATQGAERRKTKVGGLASRCNVYAGLCRCSWLGYLRNGS
jgi:hypothetical protein